LRIGCRGEYLGEITREWGKLHIVEFDDLYFSPNIILVIVSRQLGWEGHVACMGERSACRVLVGKPEGK